MLRTSDGVGYSVIDDVTAIATEADVVGVLEW